MKVWMWLLCLGSLAMAAERLNFKQVNSDQLTRETQVSQSQDQLFHLAWWIPVEFWEVSLRTSPDMSEKQVKEFVETLNGISILCVVQAKISSIGAFDFYPREEVAQGLKIDYVNGAGVKRSLVPLASGSPNQEMLLNVFKPILTAAMGNMGQNMHFFILDDRGIANKKDRVIDPYLSGKLKIQVGFRDQIAVQSSLDFPLNALYKPRKCPNGKDAHISWKFCPWGGEKLAD